MRMLTLAFAAALLLLPSLATAELAAGTAKCVITPQDDTPRVLVTGELHEAVDHDIYARALTLSDGEERVVIVTYDLNCLDVATPILRVRCRDELGLPPEQLVLLATHNHEAPIQIVPDNFDYGRWLAGRIFALIQEAIAAERGPVRLLFGTGAGDFVGKMGAKVVDTDLQVLKVVQDGEVRALLFNHPAHPMQATSTHIGVGHCGYAVDAVEEALPGALALYADACGGNQFAARIKDSGRGMAAVKALGRKLADTTLAIAAGPLEDVTGPLGAAQLEIVSLPLAPPMPYEEAKQLAEERAVPLDIGLVPYPHPDRETNWIRQLLKHYEEDIPFPKRTTDRVCTDDAFLVRALPEPREFPCKYEEAMALRIGKLVLLAMQGEVCAPIGLRIKEAFKDRVPLMVFAYMGEHNLYIPTRWLVERDIYQGKVIRIQYACPVSWDPAVEDEMGAAMIALVNRLIDPEP